MQSIADALIPKISKFDTRCLCNLAYACAITGHIVNVVVVVVVVIVIIVVIVIVVVVLQK